MAGGVVSSPPPVAQPLATQTILSLAPGGAGDLWGRYPRRFCTTCAPTTRITSHRLTVCRRTSSGPCWQTDRTACGWGRGTARRTWRRVMWINCSPQRMALPSDVIGTMLRSRDGALWIGTLHGLAKLGGGVLQPVPLADGTPADGVTALTELGNGDLLAGTRSGAIAVVHGGAAHTVHVRRAAR